jgi:hypothetical protein
MHKVMPLTLTPTITLHAIHASTQRRRRAKHAAAIARNRLPQHRKTNGQVSVVGGQARRGNRGKLAPVFQVRFRAHCYGGDSTVHLEKPIVYSVLRLR